jgi:purine-binding chemotaxis protein CheW
MSTSVFTTFRLDDQLFGIDIRFVREINKQLELSPVPHGPDYICGLINLRGQIVTVLDLKRRLGFTDTHITNDTHNLIIKTDQELAANPDRDALLQDFSIPDKVGLLVDQIGDIVTVTDDTIAQPPANVGKVDGQYLTGVVPLQEGLLTILSLQAVLTEQN